MDCNVSLAGVVDRDLIGEAVMKGPGEPSPRRRKRGKRYWWSSWKSTA